MSRRKVHRALNFRTINADLIKPFIHFVLDHDGDGAYALHPAEDGGREHYHLVARFPQATDWTKLRTDFMKVDPCGYYSNARNFRRAARYLLHLDSPQKCAVPRENLRTFGRWSGWEVDEIFHPSANIKTVLKTIYKHSRDGPMPALAALVDGGITPAQAANVLRGFVAVAKFIDDFLLAEGDEMANLRQQLQAEIETERRDAINRSLTEDEEKEILKQMEKLEEDFSELKEGLKHENQSQSI